MAKFGTMCPVNVVGSPGISMSHMCANLSCLPSGRLIVRGFIAGRSFFTSDPSIINIDVAPVSAIASDVAILMAFRYWFDGLPNILPAVSVSDVGGRRGSALFVVAFDMTTVMPSDATSLVYCANVINYRANVFNGVQEISRN